MLVCVISFTLIVRTRKNTKTYTHTHRNMHTHISPDRLARTTVTLPLFVFTRTKGGPHCLNLIYNVVYSMHQHED